MSDGWNRIGPKKDTSTRMVENNNRDLQKTKVESNKMLETQKTTQSTDLKSVNQTKDIVKSEQPVKAGKEVPQTQQKDDGARINQAASKHAENFSEAKDNAQKLNQMTSSRPTTTSGKETATKAGVTQKQMGASDGARANTPQTKVDPGVTANLVNRQIANDNASKFIRESVKSPKGETGDGKKAAEGQAKAEANPKADPKFNEAAQKGDVSGAAQLSQMGQAGAAATLKSDKADRKSEDAGPEKKAESKKKGDSSRAGGRVYTDGGEASRGLGALMSGFGGSSDDGAGEPGKEVQAASAPRAEELPETADGLHVFSDASEAEVSLQSSACLYFGSVEKRVSERLERIAEFDSKMGAMLDMGIVALSERVVADGDMELVGLLTAGLQSRRNSYGGICG